MAGLADLPQDALLHLLALLPSAQDLTAVAGTCRYLRACVDQVGCRGCSGLLLKVAL